MRIVLPILSLIALVSLTARPATAEDGNIGPSFADPSVSIVAPNLQRSLQRVQANPWWQLLNDPNAVAIEHYVSNHLRGLDASFNQEFGHPLWSFAQDAQAASFQMLFDRRLARFPLATRLSIALPTTIDHAWAAALAHANRRPNTSVQGQLIQGNDYLITRANGWYLFQYEEPPFALPQPGAQMTSLPAHDGTADLSVVVNVPALLQLNQRSSPMADQAWFSLLDESTITATGTLSAAGTEERVTITNCPGGAPANRLDWSVVDRVPGNTFGVALLHLDGQHLAGYLPAFSGGLEVDLITEAQAYAARNQLPDPIPALAGWSGTVACILTPGPQHPLVTLAVPATPVADAWLAHLMQQAQVSLAGAETAVITLNLPDLPMPLFATRTDDAWIMGMDQQAVQALRSGGSHGYTAPPHVQAARGSQALFGVAWIDPVAGAQALLTALNSEWNRRTPPPYQQHVIQQLQGFLTVAQRFPPNLLTLRSEPDATVTITGQNVTGTWIAAFMPAVVGFEARYSVPENEWLGVQLRPVFQALQARTDANGSWPVDLQPLIDDGTIDPAALGFDDDATNDPDFRYVAPIDADQQIANAGPTQPGQGRNRMHQWEIPRVQPVLLLDPQRFSQPGSLVITMHGRAHWVDAAAVWPLGEHLAGVVSRTGQGVSVDSWGGVDYLRDLLWHRY